MINQKLNQLYKNYEKTMRYLMEKHSLSSPLLMKLNNSYENQAVKLFIVGQQTHAWAYEFVSIEKLQEDYLTDCNFCKNYPTHYKSPYWRTIRSLETILGINEESIAWSNIVRFDANHQAPNNLVKEELALKLPLLKDEIKICKPDLIVFFTGPDYDWLLEKEFNDIKFSKVANKLSERQLAKVEWKGFGKKAYRTYHPAYLQRRKCTNQIINCIIHDFKKE